MKILGTQFRGSSKVEAEMLLDRRSRESIGLDAEF